MAISQRTEKTLVEAIHRAALFDAPFPHWLVDEPFPEPVLRRLRELPFAAPDLAGVSGTREVHNATRVYFDAANRAAHPVCAEVAAAFQSGAATAAIATVFGADLDGTYLRIEYGQDTDGFWLAPHTDIGVKRFTMLAYLSDGPGHDRLGTDIYADARNRVKRTPFRPNLALVFVPSERSWHGFDKRRIDGVRTSLIVNFVTDDWRARDQLAFKDTPVRPG